jgi:imidazole glycerol phosphate synthase glutamine amidotransferase subunit
VNALKAIGFRVELVASSSHFEGSEIVILPGVGNFGAVMAALRERKLTSPLKDYIANDRPFIGICVGMQILFQASSESPGESGLGVLEGRLRHLKELSPMSTVPSIGWKTLKYPNPQPQGRLEEAYFVHSYFASGLNPSDVISYYEWNGHLIPAEVGRKNIRGFQFHPEKSRASGLQFLRETVEQLLKLEPN